jgi:hypothetical protein
MSKALRGILSMEKKQMGDGYLRALHGILSAAENARSLHAEQQQKC